MNEQAQQEQLNEIANMPRGWDSYNAAPINKRAILEARRIISWMPDYWTIVPRSDGALQLERHASGLDIECVITGAGSGQETRSGPLTVAEAMDTCAARAVNETGWRCECGEWMPSSHENCTECLKDRPGLNR